MIYQQIMENYINFLCDEVLTLDESETFLHYRTRNQPSVFYRDYTGLIVDLNLNKHILDMIPESLWREQDILIINAIEKKYFIDNTKGGFFKIKKNYIKKKLK